MRKLEIISCVTNEKRYWWETKVLLNNLTSLGYTSIHILLFVRKGQEVLPEWKEIADKHNLFILEDNKDIYRISQAFQYTPLYRFYLLQEYFKIHPELSDEAIFYVDTDIILDKYIDFTPFLQDDINYLSWTGNEDRSDNYLWQPYFDSKLNQVDPLKIEQYKKLDILERLGFMCGTSRDVITRNNSNTGGAQYLLKNITSQFWTDCFNNCCEIKTYLTSINQIFMKGDSYIEKENNGFQSFCSDMWAVFYNLLAKNMPVKCPKEFDFAWSSDPISRLDTCSIVHNAGVSLEEKIKVPYKNEYLDIPLFYKGKYVEYTPFDDMENLITIYQHPIAKNYCNNKYIHEIIKTQING